MAQFILSWKKVLNLLALATIFGSASTASASFDILSRPLKIQTCELLLRGKSLRDHARSENVLPVLRDAIYKIEKQVDKSANDGVTFGSVSYSGLINKLETEKARKILERLHGIEENLTKTDLDGQIVAFEIRGSDVRSAMLKMEENETELQRLYGTEREKIYSSTARVSLWFLSFMAISGQYDFGVDLYNGLSHFSFEALPGLIFPGLMFLNNLNFAKGAAKYNIARYDWNFNSLKNFLEKATSKEPPTDEIFMGSSSIKLPIEFHKMLMAEDGSAMEDGRNVGITEWGGSYLGKLFKRIRSGDLFQHAREVSNAGDTERNVYLDQIVFYDEVAKEPVWLFFYRAFRNQPAGRKPTKHAQEDSAKDLNWSPGLTPSPLPAHGR